MSYDIDFRVKVEGADYYLSVGECDANITWNVGTMIRKSTGLEWKNCENNGLCVDVMPYIAHGMAELMKYPEKYKQYEAKNGWGTVEGTIGFFSWLLNDWTKFQEEYPELKQVVTFWIE